MSELVLLVEADGVVRQPLAEYLRECGFEVLEARSGAEAVDALANGLPIGIVLADVATVGAGVKLKGWVRKNRPDVAVVLSSSPEMSVAQAGVLCEDGPALVKPPEHSLVLERIYRAVAKRDER